MLVRSYQSPSSPGTDRHSLRLEPSPRRPVLFSSPTNSGPIRPPSPRAPMVLSSPFSYPDPLSDSREDLVSRRVQEIRRLERGTIAFENIRRRHNLPTETGPQIRPSSATGHRKQTSQSRASTTPRPKPARPNSARHRAKPSGPVSPVKKNSRSHH